MAEYLPPVVARLTGDIGDLIAKISEVKAALDSLTDRTITVKVDGRGINNLTRDVNKASWAVKQADGALKGLGNDVKKTGQESDRSGVSFTRMFQNFLKGAKAADSSGRGFWGNLLDGLRKVTGGFSKAWQGASTFERILLSLGGVGGAIVLAVAALTAFSGILSALLGGFAAAALGLGALGAAFFVLFKHSKAAKEQFKDLNHQLLQLVYQGMKPLIPQMQQLISIGFQLAKTLIPPFVQLAKAALPAVITLAKQLATALSSPAFKAWVTEMAHVAGPAIIALGHALANVTVAVAKFMTALGRRDTIIVFQDALRVTVDIITGVIRILTALAHAAQFNMRIVGNAVQTARFLVAAAAAGMRSAWHTTSVALQAGVMAILRFFFQLGSRISQVVRQIINAWMGLVHAGWNVVSAVGRIVGAIISWFENLLGRVQGIASAIASAIANMIPGGGIFSGIAHFFGFAQGTLSAPRGLAMVGERGPELVYSANAGLSRYKGYASGTAGAAPGWSWVGERGPELTYFHGGEVVLPHSVSVGVSRGYASGTGAMAAPRITVPVTVELDGQVLFQSLQERVFEYDINNGHRLPDGHPTGSMANY